ncbi:hypothetical protein, variant [Cladophialophora immunda]|nr:hypothetical protein, variant [Cladophialophora immunda]KIW33393.1 hypothetical protein, variant [Cladophialophora immunda]
MSGRMGSDGMIFTTASADLHKLRRGVLNPFFSKRSIVNYQPFIREKIQRLCTKLEQYKEDGRILAINHAFSALAGDVICQYCFGLCYNHLESPNFEESFHDAFMAVSAFGHTTLQFPWVTPLLNALPDSIVDKMNPALHMLLVLKKDFQRIISNIANSDRKIAEHATVFHEVLNSNLPEGEKTLKRLGDEAFGILGAGTETTAWALTLATFYLINQPATMKRLQEELKAAIPDPAAPLDWLRLEELPYLSACIKEAVRLSYGVTSRSPRISPNRPFKYKSWEIPAGTPVSMTIVDVHNDEAVFPDSQSFTPERWLDNPRTDNGSSLDRYYVSFGKDARSCLGVNLAHAELFMVLAAIFRQFTFELYETDVSDVRMAHDFFIPSPKLDSKGVRVKVVGINN